MHFWKPILVTLLGIFGVSALLLHFFAELRELILFGLYSTFSHFLISFFPHEPALLYYAKFYSPLSIALVSTIGCCLAGLFDYWFLLPIVSHRSIRSKFERSRIFNRLITLFHKAPFWSLVVAGFSPIPFYPFKFMSITGGYPLWKYEAALIVGRTPRYFLLAWFGNVIQLPNWLILLLALLLIGFVVFRGFSGREKKPTMGAKAVGSP